MVDIFVMAIYFSVLSVALQSQRLRRWFHAEPDCTIYKIPVIDEPTPSSLNQTSTKASCITKKISMLVCGLIALVFVDISKRLESMIKRFVPGTACGFLSVLVPCFTRRMSALPSVRDHVIWKSIQQSAEPMSLFAFLLLFGSIGNSLDASSAFVNGPACLLFSLIALATHGVITVYGSLLWNRVFASRVSNFIDRIDLADVLIASNAAIGGPATAAAFCSQLPRNTSFEHKRSLTIAATVWGVVGYAVGTTIGVSLYKILLSYI